MKSREILDTYMILVDDAFWNTSFNLRQSKAARILSEALKHLSKEEFSVLERYVFDKLEK